MAVNTCLDCVRTHVAAAGLAMEEAAAGYPHHRWWAVGDLEHAARECRRLYPELAARIREARLAIMEGGDEPDFDLMLLTICKLDDPNGSDLRMDPRNSKKFEGFA